jgi:hypothetical protein
MNGESLNTCGCCEGVKALTPQSETNRAGLAALVYRVGTHATFVETMRAALPSHSPLDLLTTRADDDPTIALLDAWATVLDVLGFYQERIANEGYLRTATERRSILELARAIGYELRPGVAASTFLAFTLETAKGAPVKAISGVGTKAQSIPAQDEKPQVFETVEEIEARGAWNELKPQTRQLILPRRGDDMVYLSGTETGLQPGDALLVIGDERINYNGSEHWDFRRVKDIKPFPSADPVQSHTAVTLDHGFGTETPHVVEPAKKNVKVYALRQRASLFGYNALPWGALPVGLRIGDRSPENNAFVAGEFSGRKDTWADAKFPVGTTKINLDAAYPKIIKDSWIVLALPTYEEVYHVTEAVEENKKDFLLAGKTTRLTIDGEHIHFFSPRSAAVFGQSEALEFAGRPDITPVQGASVVLNTRVEGLIAGRKLAVSGIDHSTGQAVSDIVTLKNTVPAGDLTQLNFTGNLTHSYQRDTVTINANVALATHGETKNEVLGSGDGSQPFQKFVLKQKPLTYVSATTPSGTKSTLEVRVNGVLWDEVRALYKLPAEERAYVVRRADDGQSSVQFGDGINGARLPTGPENVSAKYRVGIGLDGLLAERQLSLLLTRPLGVKEVINPTAPTGAADPEELAGARQNAPLTVLTLDRIVSVRDFEDFARAFAGIGKAQATLLWDGERRLVHLTVAGADGADVPATSTLFENLIAGMDAARHPDQPVRVAPFTALEFKVVAKVLVDRHFVSADVWTQIETALIKAFSFDARGFGQAVSESEVAAVMQSVDGVVAIDLDALHFSSCPVALNPRLPAHIAHWSLNQIAPAELLTINPHGIALTEMKS